MKTITIEVPDNLGGVVAESDDDLPRALQLAAAILVQSGAHLPRQRRRASAPSIFDWRVVGRGSPDPARASTEGLQALHPSIAD
jgi:hypothetical protein